jgi:hypothetical protein
MTLTPNQFTQTTVQGQRDLPALGSVISCQIDAAETATLVAGQAVKLATTAGGVPKVLALTADTDELFGYILRNFKDADFAANDMIEIALSGSVVWMTAGAAIARGAKIEVDVSETEVITNAGTNPVAGYALDAAAAAGALLRVYVLTPAFDSSQVIGDIAGLADALADRVQVAEVTATLAEINAGKELIAGVTGKTITVVGLTARVSGTFATTTSVDVQSDNATPVKVRVDAVAALSDGAILHDEATNTTLSAGWATALGSGDGLEVANVGTAATGGTSITYTVAYKQA